MNKEDVDLDAYLRRTGTRPPLAPSRDDLVRLQQAHLAAIPFENLDLLLGRDILLDVVSLQTKLVKGRRGGYCFEQNTLFEAALRRIGFTVTPLAARVRAGTTAVRPRTHMLLKVDLPEGAFVVDVGFGGDGPLHPLPLETGREQWVGAAGHRAPSRGLTVGPGRPRRRRVDRPLRLHPGPSTPPTSRWPTTSPAPTRGRRSSTT